MNQHPIRTARRATRLDRAVIISGNLHNLGDLALLRQCATGLRDRLGFDRVAVRQWNGVPPEVRNDLAAARIDLLAGKHVPQMLAATAGALVVVGGGQMVRDNAALPSLASVAGAMRWARLTGGRAAILGCGVDPLRRVAHRRLWRDILRGAVVTAVRDESSRAAAIEIGGGSAAPVLTADLMFMPTPLHRALRARDGAAHVVIAPCSDASEARSIHAGRLAALAVQACDAIGVRRVCLVAQDARADMDMRILPAIAGAIASLRPDVAIAIVAGFRLDDVLRAYAGSCLTITNRLHPAIFSLIAGRPILIVDDGTPKLGRTAERFALDRIANDADHIPDQVMARLAREATSEPPPARQRALAVAEVAAVANFDLLAEALAGIRQPPPGKP